jgi:hypothetical protein
MSVEVALQRAIFDDELGPLAREYVGSPFAWQALIAMLGQPVSPWWQDTTAGAPEGVNAATTAGAAIDRTAAELRKIFEKHNGQMGGAGAAPERFILGVRPRVTRTVTIGAA